MDGLKTATRVIDVLDEVVCNKCGQNYVAMELEEWMLDFMKKFKIDFGYGSEHDGATWRFDLCENCLIEFTNSFKIPPSVEKLPYF